MRRGMYPTVVALLAVFSGCGSEAGIQGQQIHPLKQEFQDASTWPSTGPGEIELPGFRPFRAVYERHYTQGLGPGAGEPRQDWVVVTADYAAWDDRDAIVVSMFDTGNPAYSDTNGRVWTAYVDRSNLRLFLELGPVPGEAKDYYVLKQVGDRFVGGMLYPEREEAEFQQGPPGLNEGIGIGPWAMASLPLGEGMRIRLDPFVGIVANAFGATPAMVDRKVSFVDPSGVTWATWQVDQMGSPSSPRVNRTQLLPEPPYLIARYPHNLENGEDGRGLRIVAFQYLESPSAGEAPGTR